MCGFIGCMHKQPYEQTDEILEKMNRLITHRGPDDEGYFTDDYVQLGFKRLSIIDLESGHQPLSYENGRYWIIFNGEIYNHIELRRRLVKKGYTFETESDTEVIIALYVELKEKAVKKLRGMFSFIIWDKVDQVMFGARDHFGIKPFFYLEKEDKTYFASEKKSIIIAEKREMDTTSLHHYLSFQYTPEPDTMSENIKKLEPGHFFTQKPGQAMNIQSYWKPVFRPVPSTENQIVKDIRNVLMESVNVHMRSDVPVGSFLSGGIDSSFIVSLAKQVNPKLKTFSVGFERDGFSEVDVAKETAEALNVENFSHIITSEEFIQELPKIIWHMDDPLADPAAVPLYFVAREAKKHVKVVLSGEGADELFGGYNIYREPESLQIFQSIPGPAKAALKAISRILPDGFRGKSFLERGTTPLEQRYIGNAKMFEEVEKRALLVNATSSALYTDVTDPIYRQSSNYDTVSKMQNIDIHTWLRGDILLKADKMTMAHSLELRVPFLDRKVFDVAATLSTDQKINHNTTKYALRKAAQGVVPDHVVNRKKLGFPVPIRHWLKEEMYEWAIETIQTSGTDYLFKKQEVMRLLQDHVENKKDNSRKLWTILVFMIWHQIYVEGIYDVEKEFTMSQVKQLVFQ